MKTKTTFDFSIDFDCDEEYIAETTGLRQQIYWQSTKVLEDHYPVHFCDVTESIADGAVEVKGVIKRQDHKPRYHVKDRRIWGLSIDDACVHVFYDGDLIMHK